MTRLPRFRKLPDDNATFGWGKISRIITSKQLKYLLAIALVVFWQSTDILRYFGLPWIQNAYATPIQIVLTSGTTWNVPPAWDSTNNSIEAIGAGGDGGDAVASTLAGAGGGGGEYRKVTNVTLTPSSTVDINIPGGGAGSGVAGAWLKNSGGTIQIEAKNGGNASGATAGAGGTGGTGATANYDGGAGGNGGVATNTASAGGGGGSAGPSGVGKAGGLGQADVRQGGGGGGGSNGGSSTAGVTPASGGEVGGDGGQSTTGAGAGTGGTGRNSADAQPGTIGAGGGGASNSTGSGTADGGDGGVQSLWDTNIGPSGGGGGAGGANGTGRSGSAVGGSGGFYGGGGGGGGLSGTNVSAGGSGGQGIIVITYEPSVDPSVTQADYTWFENPTGLGTTPWRDCRTESGQTTIAGGSSSSVVTLSKSISDLSQAYLLTERSGASDVQNASNNLVAGAVTNATTLTFTRGGNSGVAQIGYVLVECYLDEFSVQRGQAAIGSGSASQTASITSVDTSKSMVLVSNYTNHNTANQQTGVATGELQDSTTVLLERQSSPAVVDTINWQVVTFSDSSGATVQTGETTLGSGSASQTAGITSVDTDQSWVYCSYDADTNGLQQTAVGCDLTNSTTLTFYRDSSNAYVNRIRWYVVEYPSSGVSVQRGAVVDGGGSTDGVRYDIDINLSSSVGAVTKAFWFLTNTTSGTGTAFPRNNWISQMTSTSNLQTSYWRGSSYGSGTHYWQVIEFKSVTASVGSAMATENTPATLRSANRDYRLRMLLGVSDATLAMDTTFRLQFAPLSGSCAASTYSDVTSSSTMAYRDFYEINDGVAIVASANDPVDGSNTTEGQSYVESNNFANDRTLLSPGEDGLWDFSLTDNGASANSTYCFRAVYSDGTQLDAYTYYPQITTSDGVFAVDIVDSGGTSVSNPSADMSSSSRSGQCETSTGTLGTSSQRLRVTNHSANIPWTMSIAATDGSTALWTDGLALFDFNDPSGTPPGCAAGADVDTYAGQLGFSFGSAIVTPESGCSSAGMSFGPTAGFNEGVTDSVTLATAGSSAETGCYWDMQSISLSQAIPSFQDEGNYSLDLTITVVAN